VYYPAHVDPNPILKPWRRWGSVTGSGAGMGVADVSWEHRSLATAKRKARSILAHFQRAKVTAQVQVIDTGADGSDHAKLLVLGRDPKGERRRAKRRRRMSRRRTSRR
jgi:hypothetical protein